MAGREPVRYVLASVREPHGESLTCDGTPVVRVYDAKGRQTSTLTLGAPPPSIAPGSHRISLDGLFSGDEASRVEVTFKTRGAAEPVRATAPRSPQPGSPQPGSPRPDAHSPEAHY